MIDVLNKSVEAKPQERQEKLERKKLTRSYLKEHIMQKY